MSTKTSAMVHADWRWRMLLSLALLVIAGGVLNRRGWLLETLGNPQESPRSWKVMDLRWEPEGRFGEGIYSHSVKEIRWAAGCKDEMAAGDEGMAEPRLAVFTFRPMDLNRIDVDTLRVLRGVGPKMAAAIINYRRSHGPFRRIEHLQLVKGVGPAKFRLLCSNLDVNDPGDF